MTFTGRQSVPRLWSLMLIAGSIAGGVWVTASSWGDDPAGSPPVGWQGILPQEAPNDLRIEKLEALTDQLPASWKEWGETTTNLILDFYEQDHPTLDAQREALAALKRRLQVIETSLDSPRYRSLRPQLSSLYGRLAPRVALAGAILETLTVDEQSARARRMDPAFADLGSALSALSNDVRKFNGGSRWLTWVNYDALKKIADAKDASSEATQAAQAVKDKLARRGSYADEVRDFLSREAFLKLEDALGSVLAAAAQPPKDQTALRALLTELADAVEGYLVEPTAARAYDIRRLDVAIRAAAPDGGQQVTNALNTNFFNYNFRAFISEGLVKRLIQDRRVERSGVNEYMSGAYVRGSQVTDATLSVDVQPSRDGAQLVLQLSGNVRSNTQGFASEATVQSVGYHAFWASKPVHFDGERFVAGPASVRASANNQIVDATTVYSGGLFGGIADRIAMREAQARTGEANWHTINRIRQQVGEQLDREADEQLQKASMRLQEKVYGPLREYGLYPQTVHINSTDSEIIYRSRLMEASELGGSRPLPGYAIPSNGALFLIHESLLTNSTERLGLNGKTMTESEVRELLEERLTNILGREVDLPEPKAQEGEQPMNNILVFNGEDAVRFSIQNGMVTIIIRAGLQRKDAEEIPEHIIEVPLKFTVEGDQILMTRGGEVAVRPAPGTPRVSTVETIARQNVMRQTIQSALSDSTFKSVFEADLEGKTVPLRVTEVQAEAGWLAISLR